MLASEGILVWGDPGCPGNAKAPGPGADEAAPPVQVSCWPNPTDGKVFVSASQRVAGTVRVFDAYGRLLFVRTGDLGDAPLELDGSGWSQGLLLVTVQLGDGTVQRWRILLQR